MVVRQIECTVFGWLLPSFAALAIGATPAGATDISWRTTSSLTANEGYHYACEGTAVFANGEEAHMVSGLTIRFVAVWNETMSRNGGILVDGTGHFAGVIGAATAAARRPASGPTSTDWTATYELAPKWRS